MKHFSRTDGCLSLKWSLQLYVNINFKLCSVHCMSNSVFSFISQVNKSCVSVRDHRIKMCTSQQKNRLKHEQQSQTNLFSFWCHPSQCPPASLVAFPVSARFCLVLCASWVMDYLSAVSQYNNIHCCSPSCTARSSDEASLHFLFGSPQLLLLGFGVSSTFNYPPSRFFYSTVRQVPRPGYTPSLHLCVFASESRNLHIWIPRK